MTGNRRFLWLPTVADPGKPTVAEIAAAFELNPTFEIPPLPELVTVEAPRIQYGAESYRISCPDCEHYAEAVYGVPIDPAIPHVCIVDGRQVHRGGTHAVVLPVEESDEDQA